MERSRKIRLLLLACLLALLAFRLLTLPPSAEQQLAAYMGRQVLVTGDIEPLSVRDSGGFTSAVVRCRRLEVLHGGEAPTPVPYSGRLRVSLQGSLPEAGRVELSGMLEELVSLRNPGGFDAQAYNRVQELGGRVSRAQLVRVEPRVLWWQRFALWNKCLSQSIEQAAGKEYGALLSGMVLGGSGRLDEETRELFTNNGLAHLLSVSGTHLLLLTGLLLAVLRPVPLPWRRLSVVALLMAYAVLCGLRPPVLRALVMSSVLLLGGRGAERGRLLLLAAAGLLCWQPLWLQDIGFQLSFAAAAGLLWLLPACKRLLPEALPEPVSEGLAVTLAAQLAVLPLEVYYFHQFSLIALVSNILLVPVLELAAQLALVGALLPVLGVWLLQAAAWLTAQVVVQARFFAGLPWSTLVVGELPAYCLVLYYALLALLADFGWLQLLRNAERRVAIGCCVLLLAATVLYQQYRPLPLTCYFLDVGQGDCAVVVTPSHRIAVIDTGGLQNLSTGARVVAPFLRTLGKREIDVLLVSHYDYDHVGGAVDLLRHVRVKTLVLPNEALTEESSKMRQRLLAEAQRAQVQLAASGLRYELDDGVELTLVDVPPEAVAGNEASTLAALVCAQGSVLFTGDMGAERERWLELAHYDVLKAGHHGSRYSSSPEFLQQVQPELTVLSCGMGNRYGHPHAETLERLRDVGSAAARTDEQGCVKVVFDEGGGWRCYVYGEMRWQRLQFNNL